MYCGIVETDDIYSILIGHVSLQFTVLCFFHVNACVLRYELTIAGMIMWQAVAEEQSSNWIYD